MDQNQIDKTLYIDKFKEQVELLFNLYEHPKYLELLDGKKDLLNKLQTELKNIITNTLVKPKDNSEQISLKKRIVAVIDDNFKNSNYTLLSALGPILETEFNFYSSNSSYK